MKNALCVLVTTISLFGLTATAGAAPSTGPITGEVPLVVNEQLHRFETPTRLITLTPGVSTFTVMVPRKARNRHGVAINGGFYRNIIGAAVRPGRTTSLTVQLRPGLYTVFDPVRSNRKRGYYVKIRVLKMKRERFVPPAPACTDLEFMFGMRDLYATGISCAAALDLSDKVGDTWRARGYTWGTFPVDTFSCTVEGFGRWGLVTDCIDGARRIVLRKNI